LLPRPDRLGRARPDHPCRARPVGPRAGAEQPPRAVEGAGHFPHLDEPQRFLDVLLDFIESTVPADMDPKEWREMLNSGRQ
jgi:pimeloyl-ACP methyl ester carboxylesterase